MRTIVTATHTREDLQFALDTFGRVGTALGIVLGRAVRVREVRNEVRRVRNGEGP